MDREELIMEVIREMIEGKHALNRVVETGPRWHVKLLDLVNSSKM